MATIAVKRVSAVEVDPDASHQREFHADRFRRELGFEGDRVEGPLRAVYRAADGHPVVDDARFTLYQARKPPRSEFRLYPATNLFRERARVGDLMLAFRDTQGGLQIVVAEAGSHAEAELLDSLFLRGADPGDAFTFLAPDGGAAAMRRIGDALSIEPPDANVAIARNPVFADAIASGHYPTTAAMAAAAQGIVRTTLGDSLDPDAYLWETMAAESRLFFAIERELAGAELAVLVSTQPDVTKILEWSTRRLNSRKSRRGHSLQRHFEALLQREGIPFTPECVVEAPPPADVMVPSQEAYADLGFPSDHLRLVSCKTTLKERWMEIVPEARRVETKYVLTLDEKITDSVIRALHSAAVRPFLPAQVISTAYQDRATAHLLSSVSDLVGELRNAILP